ncbi:MAG: RbsD/FucU domain-containing protein [Propionicimonas sp.]
MLTTQLIHPPLLAALAAAGHGSKVLIADSNYPHATAHGPNAEVVHLNVSRGLVNGTDTLAAIASVITIESAAVMAPGDEFLSVHEEYRELLGADVPVTIMERFAFYEACRGNDLALLVATGEDRIYANLLLTIGVAPAPAN